MTQPNIVKLQNNSFDAHQVLSQDIEQFQNLCRENPDLIPQFVVYADSQIAYMVGFWWLSLDEGQKTQALEKHIQFVEKYSLQTCMNYSSICKKIPTSYRQEVIEKINMKLLQMIVEATSDQKELNELFNIALSVPISARLMADVIKERKQSKPFADALILRLPEIIQGNRNDRSRFDKIKAEIQQSQKTAEQIQTEKEEKLKQEIETQVKLKVEASLKAELEKARKEAVQAKASAVLLEREIEAYQNQETTQVTIFDDTQEQILKIKLKNRDKELEKLQTQFADLATKTGEEVIKIYPDDYEDLKKKAEKYESLTQEMYESRKTFTESAQNAAREVWKILYTPTTSSLSQYTEKDREVFNQILELLKPMI
jgi:hypothetical protein